MPQWIKNGFTADSGLNTNHVSMVMPRQREDDVLNPTKTGQEVPSRPDKVDRSVRGHGEGSGATR